MLRILRLYWFWLSFVMLVTFQSWAVLDVGNTADEWYERGVIDVFY